jgi:hypothetical protein
VACDPFEDAGEVGAGEGPLERLRDLPTCSHLMLEVNERQCDPPLEPRLVRKQTNGAAKWAESHPTVDEELRAEARRVFEEHRAPAGGRGRGAPGRAAFWEQPMPLASREAAPAFPIETLLDWSASWATAVSAEKGAALDLGASLAL